MPLVSDRRSGKLDAVHVLQKSFVINIRELFIGASIFTASQTDIQRPASSSLHVCATGGETLFLQIPNPVGFQDEAVSK